MQDSNVQAMAAPGKHGTIIDSLPHGSTKDTIITPIQDHTVMNASDSSNVSYHKNPITSIRPQLPTLVNTNVKDFGDSRMEIDSDSESSTRKRTLPTSNSESQCDYVNKKKSVTIDQSNSKDSLINADKNKKILLLRPNLEGLV